MEDCLKDVSDSIGALMVKHLNIFRIEISLLLKTFVKSHHFFKDCPLSEMQTFDQPAISFSKFNSFRF